VLSLRRFSSGPRGKPLPAPPGRVVEAPVFGVSDLGLVSPADVDRGEPGFVVWLVVDHEDDLSAVGRVDGAVVIPIVVGDLKLSPSTDIDRVDLGVVSVVVSVSSRAALVKVLAVMNSLPLPRSAPCPRGYHAQHCAESSIRGLLCARRRLLSTLP
jgi:hypothetical protein